MKNTSLTKLLIFVDIQLAILLGLVIFYGISTRVDMYPNEAVLGSDIQIVQQDFKVSVCSEGMCVWVESEEVRKDGDIDRGMVYQIVLDRVFPYFEEAYGGKAYISNENGSFVYWKNDLRPDLNTIFDDVYIALTSGKDTNIELEVSNLPSTDGKYAERYIEIDESQQKLFVWVNGHVVKEISNPHFTRFGVFPIDSTAYTSMKLSTEDRNALENLLQEGDPILLHE